MGSVAKKGLQQYIIQLQRHPLRTKVLIYNPRYFLSSFFYFRLLELFFCDGLLLFSLSLCLIVHKAITAGVLSAISDIVSQKLTGIQKLQLKRLLLKVLFGAVYLGPFGHFLHLILDKIFKGKKDSKTVAKKVLVEQLTSSPWNNLLFMIYYGLVIEGRPWFQVKTKIKKDYPSVQYTAWTFWPVVGWINHQYVSLQFRVIVHSFVAFCWGIYLNLRARSMALPKPK